LKPTRVVGFENFPYTSTRGSTEQQSLITNQPGWLDHLLRVRDIAYKSQKIGAYVRSVCPTRTLTPLLALNRSFRALLVRYFRKNSVLAKLGSSVQNSTPTSIFFRWHMIFFKKLVPFAKKTPRSHFFANAL